MKAWAPRFGLILTPLLIEKLAEHFELLLRWNEKTNLTRITDPEEAARFHYLESLYAGMFLDSEVRALVDVGSGGGFPGIPLALARPDLRVILIERNRKKAVFLEEAIKDLRLENAEVFCGAFQIYPRDDFQGLICRALDRFARQVSDLLNFARRCAQVLFLCGADLEPIVARHALLLWALTSVAVPHSRERRLLILRPRER